MDLLNILMVALLYRNYLMQTIISGDTSRFSSYVVAVLVYEC